MSGLGKRTTKGMRATFEFEMSEQTKREHQSTISDALGEYPHQTPATKRFSWRLKARALVAAAFVVLPAGTAIASTNTVPGDLLYPVKRIVEPVWGVSDSDIVAHHRVDELEKLLDIQAEDRCITDAVTDAQLAVIDLPNDHHLQTDLVALTDRVTDLAPSDTAPSDTAPSDQRESDTSPDSPITDKSQDSATTTHAPTDKSPTTDAPSGTQSPGHVTTTTKASDSGDQDSRTDSDTDSATTDG